eukprot:s514_g7.t1
MLAGGFNRKCTFPLFSSSWRYLVAALDPAYGQGTRPGCCTGKLGETAMESLQRLAALPLVDNACASRANRDSWSYSVFCREVRPAEAEDPDAMLVSNSDWPVHVKLLEVVAGDLLKQADPKAAIVAYSEWRSKFSEGQYLTLLFYHAFMMLEVEGGLAICTEKYNDKLELLFGEKQLLSTYARAYRATGDQRKPSAQHSQCKVERPYCLINSNCQHYARDLIHFLSQDGAAFAQLLCRDREESLQDDRALVLAAVSTDGLALRFASARRRAERPVAFAAVRQNGKALEFCERHLRNDEEPLDLDRHHDAKPKKAKLKKAMKKPAAASGPHTKGRSEFSGAVCDEAKKHPLGGLFGTAMGDLAHAGAPASEALQDVWSTALQETYKDHDKDAVSAWVSPDCLKGAPSCWHLEKHLHAAYDQNNQPKDSDTNMVAFLPVKKFPEVFPKPVASEEPYDAYVLCRGVDARKAVQAFVLAAGGGDEVKKLANMQDVNLRGFPDWCVKGTEKYIKVSVKGTVHWFSLRMRACRILRHQHLGGLPNGGEDCASESQDLSESEVENLRQAPLAWTLSSKCLKEGS